MLDCSIKILWIKTDSYLPILFRYYGSPQKNFLATPLGLAYPRRCHHVMRVTLGSKIVHVKSYIVIQTDHVTQLNNYR